MRHLFYLMGKSASGKDTIYEELLRDESLNLDPLIPWTTRPIRDGEKDGQEYHYTDEEGLRRLELQGRVIEKRTYSTVLGPWTYFTVDDGILEKDRDLLGIGTLDSYVKIRDYFRRAGAKVLAGPEASAGAKVLAGPEASAGANVLAGPEAAAGADRRTGSCPGTGDTVVPLYIQVDDGLRLQRALKREMKPGNHKYEEMCRRFLADQRDFSEDRLKAAGIELRFENDADRAVCIRQVADYIRRRKCADSI